MKRTYGQLIISCFLYSVSFAQDVPLFQSKEPINLRLSGSIKSIKKNSNDSTFVSGKFEYQLDTQWISMPVQARVRGNFRLKNCFFPPLKLKFAKGEVASTLFAGNKTVKLVLPCRTASDKNDLIRKEYLCYQFYQILATYFFRTRLANIQLTENTKKKERKYDLLSFFVEDNSIVAKRAGGKVIKIKGVNPAAFDEKSSVRNDFF